VTGSPVSAIDAYHSLLTDEIAQASQDQLERQLRSRGLYFGDRPLCTVLRPRFLTPEQYRTLQTGVARIMGPFRTAYAAAMASPSVRSQFALLDWEERMLGCGPGFRDPSPASRLDAFFLPHGVRFTEYNAETPAGSAYTDALSTVFYGLPVMREFLRSYDVRPLPARHGVLHVLLDAFRQWSGRSELLPQIAILDWNEVPTRSEFILFQEYFRSQGLQCEIVDPREVEYRGGRLLAGPLHVTLVYKRVLLSELVGREGLDTPVLQAVRERAVCMVNPFQCKLLHKKTSLAVLSDERNATLFTPEERQAIEAYIPWTRRVEERRTEFRAHPIDLVPFILQQRENLVLKPSDDYGGAGIVLGWEVDSATWEQAVAKALAQPYVVQERVALPFEPFPTVLNGAVDIRDRMLDTAPFIAYGEYADGCLTRLSSAALLNVTAGGGSTVPTFIVEKRGMP
jgi:Circularly permuted ATP-grasp type 2